MRHRGIVTVGLRVESGPGRTSLPALLIVETALKILKKIRRYWAKILKKKPKILGEDTGNLCKTRDLISESLCTRAQRRARHPATRRPRASGAAACGMEHMASGACVRS
eukprot:6074107-Prymnesium_polylepis.1